MGRFSAECRSTDAISVLYQQFEKFVWPTVPEQEERISQIAELAVRLHGASKTPAEYFKYVQQPVYSNNVKMLLFAGAEEGQRYIDRTVSKHSEMVGSIRELSDQLMDLEAQLKVLNSRTHGCTHKQTHKMAVGPISY